MLIVGICSSSLSYSSSDESDDELYKYTYELHYKYLVAKKIDKMMAAGGDAYLASKPASIFVAPC
jgi:hypothetical protein